LNPSGAPASTANQDSTSVSPSLTGCHCRMEMNGRTSSDVPTRGQLCTKLRFGYREAAEIIKPSAPMTRCWPADQDCFICSIIWSG